jgi:nucleoside-diphosphate-sugar epimerase
MRALVTGSAGFIGRHMAVALQAAGYDVTGRDVRSHPASASYDARDLFARDDRRFDVIVHAAAVVGGRAQIDNNPLALAVNLELDAALFRFALRSRPGRVVYLSSSAAYPASLQSAQMAVPLSESAIRTGQPQEPDSLYGWMKLTGERLAALAVAQGIPVTVVRPFSGYGEDQDDDYPFPAIAARVCRRENPLTVWGSGDQVRDWIHVDDICFAIMTMISEGIDGPVNLGTGRGTSIRELAAKMAAAAGYPARIQPLPGKPSGVDCRVADVSRMRAFFEPKVTLEDGVARALRSLPGPHSDRT